MVTVFICYTLDPFKLDVYEAYAKKLLDIIPACGGELVGYFMPHEGTNNTAFGIITLPSLAEYEAYRARVWADAAFQSAFAEVTREQVILHEARTFLRPVVKS